ncbi:hypothetical protein LINPERHAP1_LOCUS767, partial [Linum perenne]
LVASPSTEKNLPPRIRRRRSPSAVRFSSRIKFPGNNSIITWPYVRSQQLGRELERKKKRKMAKSCKGLATELVKCLGESDCVKVENRSIRECSGEKSPSVPSECVGLRETYFNCKRGQVKPILSDLKLSLLQERIGKGQ